MSPDDLFNHYDDQPREVSIETQAVCNAGCEFCPYPTITRKGTRMPDELLWRLMDEMQAFDLPFCFSPFKLSDPLLDNRLPQIIDRANDIPQCTIRIFTNGQALTDRKVDDLARAKRLELYVSLNAHTADEYAQRMGLKPEAFDRVCRNLDNLHARDFPHRVHVLRVGRKYEFHQFVVERWPKFDGHLMIKQDGWLGYVEADVHVPPPRCHRWLELSIMATGVVSLCCMDGHGDHAIGDVNNESMLGIYRRWTFRRNMNRRDLVPCGTCTY